MNALLRIVESPRVLYPHRIILVMTFKIDEVDYLHEELPLPSAIARGCGLAICLATESAFGEQTSAWALEPSAMLNREEKAFELWSTQHGFELGTQQLFQHMQNVQSYLHGQRRELLKHPDVGKLVGVSIQKTKAIAPITDPLAARSKKCLYVLLRAHDK